VRFLSRDAISAKAGSGVCDGYRDIEGTVSYMEKVPLSAAWSVTLASKKSLIKDG